MMNRSVLGFLTILTAAAVAAGCGSEGGGSGGGSSRSTDSGGELASEQVLRLNIGADPGEGFDPPRTSYVESVNVINQMFAGLYRVNDDSELVPFIAAELPEVSEDGLTYTVKLRDDAKWSDGRELTAEDAVFGIQYSLRNATGAYFAQYMLDIKGAREFNASKDPKEDPSGIGVTAPDDTTLVIELEKEVPWFKGLLSLQTFYPLRQDVIEEHGERWTEPENIVVSGPFTLSEYRPKDAVVMVRNDEWWGAEDVDLERIEMKVIDKPVTAVEEFDAGRIDASFVNTGVPSEQIDELKERDEYLSTQTSSIAYMYMNTTNPKLRDPKVRQGISMAIDRELIVKTVTRRGDLPAGSTIPEAIPGYETITDGSDDFIQTEDEPDLDRARELLEEGGWKEGDELNFYFPSDSAVAPSVAEAIQGSLDKVGVKVKLVPVPGDAMQQTGVGVSPIGPKVDLLAQGWAADYLDAQNYYQLFTCENVDNGLNGSNFCDEDFDEVYAEALETVDDDARFELYRDLEARLTGPDGAMPAAPLYQPTDDTLVQKWVRGYEISPTSLLYLDDVAILEH